MNTDQNEIRRLREENEKLRNDNEALMRKAMGYAAFGDIMRTIALLPLDTDEKTDRFKERIQSALMLHGISPESSAGVRLRSSFLQAAMPEREKIVRAFVSAGKARDQEGRPPTTPGCTCMVCSGVAAAETIVQNDPRRHGRKGVAQSEEIAGGDLMLTKTMERRATPEDGRQLQEMVDNLLQLFGDMGLGPQEDDIDELLSAMFGGMLRGEGRRAGRIGNIEVMTIGPVPPGLRRLFEEG